MCLETFKRYKCGCKESTDVTLCKRVTKIHDLLIREGYAVDHPRIAALHEKCEHKSAERFFLQSSKCAICLVADAGTADDRGVLDSVEDNSNDDSRDVKGKKNVFGNAVDDNEEDVMPSSWRGMTRETTVADSETYDEDNFGSGEDEVDDIEDRAEGKGTYLRRITGQTTRDRVAEDREENEDGSNDDRTITTGYLMRDGDPDDVEVSGGGDEDEGEDDVNDYGDDEDSRTIMCGHMVQDGYINYDYSETIEDEDMDYFQ